MKIKAVVKITGSLLDVGYVKFSRIIRELKGKIRHLDTFTNTYDVEVTLTRRDIRSDFIDEVSKLSRYCSVSIRVYVVINEKERLLKSLKDKRIRYVKVDGNIRFAVIKDGMLFLHEYNSRSGVLHIYVIPGIHVGADTNLLALSEFSSYVASSSIRCDSAVIEDMVKKAFAHVDELLS
ncbi:MAG: hypothetical protein DRO14_01300 [Thermoprotei archaeon]|nr:MAG: hypothetical protein DRO14_01300 [Thermoprotei archaeon]